MLAAAVLLFLEDCAYVEGRYGQLLVQDRATWLPHQHSAGCSPPSLPFPVTAADHVGLTCCRLSSCSSAVAAAIVHAVGTALESNLLRGGGSYEDTKLHRN